MEQTLKRILSVSLALILLCSLLPMSVLAASPTSGQCGDNAYWEYDTATGTLTVSGTGESWHYNFDDDPWYAYRDMISSVVIQEGITGIGSGSFYQFANLTDVQLPETLRVIGDFAFMGCSKLETLTIPEGVVEMSGAFRNCGLKCVYLPKSLVKVGHDTFSFCWHLTDVYYSGTNADWNKIEVDIYNEWTTTANIHFEEADSGSPFKDVKESDWYYKAVLWAVENGITGGVAPNTFGPNDSCTRAQVVTFLWAAAGKPEPAVKNNPFKDVKSSDWYYKAVLWAVEQGITGGLTADTFGPNNTCTRAQIVTFLYAAEGKPYVSGTSTFSDVNDSDWFAKAVKWAAKYDVTGGIGNGMFGPNNTCTRGQVVTFLYKADQVDPNSYETSPLKAYIPAVEDALKTLPSPSYFNGSGFLCDLDKDGLEELVLFWLNDSLEQDGIDAWGHVFSIYDVENGKPVTKIDQEVLCYDAGGPSGSVAAADYSEQRVFMICDSNSSYIDGVFANYEHYTLYDIKSFEEIVSITAYRDFNTDKVLKCYKNGKVCTYDAYKKVYDAINFIVESEIYNNSDSDGSKSLYGMLSYLQSNAGIEATQPAKITQAQAEQIAYNEWSDDLNSNSDRFQYKYAAEGSIIHDGVEYYLFALYEKFGDYDWSVYEHLVINSVTGKIADRLY